MVSLLTWKKMMPIIVMLQLLLGAHVPPSTTHKTKGKHHKWWAWTQNDHHWQETIDKVLGWACSPKKDDERSDKWNLTLVENGLKEQHSWVHFALELATNNDYGRCCTTHNHEKIAKK